MSVVISVASDDDVLPQGWSTLDLNLTVPMDQPIKPLLVQMMNEKAGWENMDHVWILPAEGTGPEDLQPNREVSFEADYSPADLQLAEGTTTWIWLQTAAQAEEVKPVWFLIAGDEDVIPDWKTKKLAVKVDYYQPIRAYLEYDMHRKVQWADLTHVTPYLTTGKDVSSFAPNKAEVFNIDASPYDHSMEPGSKRLLWFCSAGADPNNWAVEE